jgi:hypothetical protein
VDCLPGNEKIISKGLRLLSFQLATLVYRLIKNNLLKKGLRKKTAFTQEKHLQILY